MTLEQERRQDGENNWLHDKSIVSSSFGQDRSNMSQAFSNFVEYIFVKYIHAHYVKNAASALSVWSHTFTTQISLCCSQTFRTLFILQDLV